MKFELNDDEKEQLKNALERNNVRKWFAAKEQMKFEIGDVLVKYFKRHENGKEKLIVENINSDNKMAQRYVYIHEDECGIGYIKQLRVSDGTLGKELMCLTDFDYDSCIFSVDPEYAETQFLGAEFDIKDVHKASLAARKVITKMNRKIGTKPKNFQDFNEWIEKVGIGGTFYSTHDYTGRYMKEYKITNIEKVSIQSLDRENDWWWRRIKEKKTIDVNSSYTYKVTSTGCWYNRSYYFVEVFDGNVLYIQQPAQEDKKV